MPRRVYENCLRPLRAGPTATHPRVERYPCGARGSRRIRGSSRDV